MPSYDVFIKWLDGTFTGFVFDSPQGLYDRDIRTEAVKAWNASRSTKIRVQDIARIVCRIRGKNAGELSW